jgi:nucleotide-binding universal stress UspA family protein
MLKSILLPLDPSSANRAAAEYAFALAKRKNASVVGLSVVDEPGIDRSEAVPAGAAEFHRQKVETQLNQAAEKAGQLTREFEKRGQGHGVKTTPLIRRGDPAEEIISESHRHDLVILARSTFFKFITEDGPCKSRDAILRASPRAAIVVPEKSTEGTGVLFATDGSATAARSLQMQQLLGVMDGEYRVLAVQATEAEALLRCNAAADYLAHHARKARTLPVDSTQKPAHVILDVITQERPALLAIGAYGVSGLRELFFGSVTRDLLDRSPVPIFLYH